MRTPLWQSFSGWLPQGRQGWDAKPPPRAASGGGLANWRRAWSRLSQLGHSRHFERTPSYLRPTPKRDQLTSGVTSSDLAPVGTVHGVGPHVVLVERAEPGLPGGAVPCSSPTTLTGSATRSGSRPATSPHRCAPLRQGVRRVGRRGSRWIRSCIEDVSGYRHRLGRPAGLDKRAQTSTNYRQTRPIHTLGAGAAYYGCVRHPKRACRSCLANAEQSDGREWAGVASVAAPQGPRVATSRTRNHPLASGSTGSLTTELAGAGFLSGAVERNAAGADGLVLRRLSQGARGGWHCQRGNHRKSRTPES